jgi:hypothetical protein
LNYNNSLSLWNFDEYFLKCRVRTSAHLCQMPADGMNGCRQIKIWRMGTFGTSLWQLYL